MMYEVEYERADIEGGFYRVMVDAPAFRVIKSTGQVRLPDRFMEFIFSNGHANSADLAIVGMYRPVTIHRDGSLDSALYSELTRFNLAGMRKSTAALRQEVTT